MDPSDAGYDEIRPTRAEIEGVLAATRVLVAISAQSVAKVENRVTLPQLRVLVIIASRGPQNLNSVAQALGVHPSNVTRICNKLVHGGLIHRGDDPTDRRHLVLQLTESGRQLVHTINEHRRAAIATILAKMRIEQRRSLVPELLAFADAAGEVFDSRAWALGWATQLPPTTHEQNSTESRFA